MSKFKNGAKTSINEKVAGTAVYKAAAPKKFDGGGVTYWISGKDDGASFNIAARSGIVTIKPTPNFEIKSTYNFIITAVNAAGQKTPERVTLSINDLSPVLSGGVTTKEKSEMLHAHKPVSMSTKSSSAPRGPSTKQNWPKSPKHKK